MTGGAGFIGSLLVDSLLHDGLDVTVLDNFDPFYERRLKEQNVESHRTRRNWRLVEGDLRNLDEIAAQLPGPYDAVVHLAAQVGVRPSIEDPLASQDVNVRGTQNMLELARRLRVPHFVFASSSSVYGVNPRVPWNEADSVLQPISPYASTKVSGELLGHVYSHLFGIRFIALRLFTVYGPRQRPDLAIHKFARLIGDRRPIPVFGDGTTRRDYTFVDDIVSGLRAALLYNRSRYEVINLGNNQTVTLLDMIRAIEEALGIPAQLDWLPQHPGDVPQTCADIEKARTLLAYEPRTKFGDGVKQFVQWFNSTRQVEVMRQAR